MEAELVLNRMGTVAMATDIKPVLETTFSPVGAWLLRTIALFATMTAAAVEKSRGSSWWTVLLVLLIVAAIAVILPFKAPVNNLQRKALSALRTSRLAPRLVRVASITLLIGGATIAGLYIREIGMGRGFNVFFLPIFLTALLFGLRAGALAIFLSLPPLCYINLFGHNPAFHILDVFPEIIIFTYLGAVIAMIPILLYESANLAAEESGRG